MKYGIARDRLAGCYRCTTWGADVVSVIIRRLIWAGQRSIHKTFQSDRVGIWIDADVSLEFPVMRIRECRASDLPAVRAIEEACYGLAEALPLIALKQYQELCGEGFIVCDSESGLAGFAIGGIALEDRERGWILNVSVLPDFQKRGIGQALCENLLSTLDRNGMKTVRATVSPDNSRSLKMLGRFGFEVIDDLADYFGPGQRRLLIERRT